MSLSEAYINAVDNERRYYHLATHSLYFGTLQPSKSFYEYQAADRFRTAKKWANVLVTLEGKDPELDYLDHNVDMLVVHRKAKDRAYLYETYANAAEAAGRAKKEATKPIDPVRGYSPQPQASPSRGFAPTTPTLETPLATDDQGGVVALPPEEEVISAGKLIAGVVAVATIIAVGSRVIR